MIGEANFKSLENAVNNKMETRQFLNENGEVLGFAKIIYFESPFPFYFVVRFEINEDKRGEGYGKEMLLQFNKFLQDSNKVGILIDSIDENNPSSGMYARNGWKEISEHKG